MATNSYKSMTCIFIMQAWPSIVFNITSFSLVGPFAAVYRMPPWLPEAGAIED